MAKSNQSSFKRGHPFIKSTEAPFCFDSLTQPQKDHIQTILQLYNHKSKKLLEHLQDESGWHIRDCERVVDWYFGRFINSDVVPS